MVRVFNDRGACLAGVLIENRVRPDVVQLSTGAWFDPQDPADPNAMCVHGNPNVLTDGVGTSSFGPRLYGCARAGRGGRFDAALPPVRAHDPPVIRHD